MHILPREAAFIARHLPERYRRRYLEGFFGDARFNFDQRGGNNRADTEVSDGGPPASNPEIIRRQILEPFNIEWAVVTGAFYMLNVMVDPDYSAAIASAQNEWCMGEFLEIDPAFLGSITISAQDPALAVREIRKWADHPRVVQVFMATASTLPMGHRHYDPIYSAAAECGLPLAVHTTIEGRGVSGPPTSTGYPSKYLEFHSGLAAAAMTQTASLVCGGAFARHPKLKVILLEGGISWALPLMWQLDADWKRLREEMPFLRELPSETLKRQMFYTTQPIEEPEKSADLLHVYEQIAAATQVMFSSDYLHWDFDNPFHILPGATAAELKRRILWENARSLYAGKLTDLEAKRRIQK
jgi:predicted TIM-barrel fold metal-dependent hydrolase